MADKIAPSAGTQATIDRSMNVGVPQTSFWDNYGGPFFGYQLPDPNDPYYRAQLNAQLMEALGRIGTNPLYAPQQASVNGAYGGLVPLGTQAAVPQAAPAAPWSAPVSGLLGGVK